MLFKKGLLSKICVLLKYNNYGFVFHGTYSDIHDMSFIELYISDMEQIWSRPHIGV